MKKYLSYFALALLLVSCDNDDPGTDPVADPEEPAAEVPTDPDPEPEAPEGTLNVAGLFWDTENTFDYCSIEEAREEASKQGKRIPTREEWEELAETGSCWDDELLGRWYGTDAELKSDSQESIFFPALGSFWTRSDTYAEIGKTGYYWPYIEPDKALSIVMFSSVSNPIYTGIPANQYNYYSLRLVQDK